MISRWQVAYGAVLPGLVAAIFLWLASRTSRSGQPAVILVGAAASTAGALAWNAILQATSARQFFHDQPFVVFPVAWQDTGSGVFALGLAAVALGLGPLAARPARRALLLALLCGLAALLTDIYLY